MRNVNKTQSDKQRDILRLLNSRNLDRSIVAISIIPKITFGIFSHGTARNSSGRDAATRTDMIR